MILLHDLYITSSCVIARQSVMKNGRLLLAGEEQDLHSFLTVVYQHLASPYPKFYKMDLLSKLGWLSAEVLLHHNDDVKQYAPADVGVVLSNASSSIDTDRRYFETTKSLPSPALFVYTLPNIMIGEICIRHGFKGENAFFITENFDAGFLWQYVGNLFNIDTLQACICGWVEVGGSGYESALFLVEKKAVTGSSPFTPGNLKAICETR
jgi:hypothetical protein